MPTKIPFIAYGIDTHDTAKICRSLSLPARAAFAVVTAFAMIAIDAGVALALDPEFCAPYNEPHGACYGLEPTFTKPALQQEPRGGPKAQAAADLWRAKVKQKCADWMPYSCRIEQLGADSTKLEDKCQASKETPSESINKGQQFRVCIYRAGETPWARPWWYEVTFDNNVIELKTRPSNALWLQVLSDEGIIDRLVFETAHAIGLAPHPVYGGGHIHIDVASGFASPVHLVNFMTRIHNLRMLPLRPDLNGMGLNAPPLATLGFAARDRYNRFIHGDLSKYDAPGGLVRLTEDLANEVYIDTYSDRLLGPGDAALIKERYAALRDLHAMESRHLPPYDEEAWGVPPDYSKLPPEVTGVVTSAADWDREFHYRGKKEDTGFGWAHKAQHIRMAPQYGTIEIRNLAAPRSVADIRDLIWLISSAINKTPNDHTLELDPDLAFDGTDSDLPKAWRLDERKSGFRPKRFVASSALTPEEAADIAHRLLAFVENDKLVCRLVGMMPEEIGKDLKPVCAPKKS